MVQSVVTNERREFVEHERDAIHRVKPAHIGPIAYLCLGYAEAFGTESELERCGWEKRILVEEVVSRDVYCSNSISTSVEGRR